MSFVVPKKRAWFALNQTYCQLENYYTEADFVSKKSPVDIIDVSRSAILPDISGKNEFVIL